MNYIDAQHRPKTPSAGETRDANLLMGPRVLPKL